VTEKEERTSLAGGFAGYGYVRKAIERARGGPDLVETARERTTVLSMRLTSSRILPTSILARRALMRPMLEFQKLQQRCWNYLSPNYPSTWRKYIIETET
jgi:hypothetical protein